MDTKHLYQIENKRYFFSNLPFRYSILFEEIESITSAMDSDRLHLPWFEVSSKVTSMSQIPLISFLVSV